MSRSLQTAVNLYALGVGVGAFGTIGALPSREVLDAVRRLCSSQDCRAPEVLGTDLGDRLRGARAMRVRNRGNNKGHLLASCEAL